VEIKNENNSAPRRLQYFLLLRHVIIFMSISIFVLIALNPEVQIYFYFFIYIFFFSKFLVSLKP